jgi:uncharacterized membrane protein YhhN
MAAEEPDWRLIVEFRRIHDQLGSMRGMYFWIGLGTAAIGVGGFLGEDKKWTTTTGGVLFLLAAVCYFLGWWRVHREPRLWTLLCASVYTGFGTVSVIRYFLGDETIRSAGVRYHYVIGVILILALWSVVPRKKTLAFLKEHAEEWDQFRSKKKPEWWG